MELPTLETSVDLLKAVTGLDDFDPDEPLPRSKADSLDLVEWLDRFQDEHPGVTIDESLLEDVDDTVTFRHIHQRVVDAHFAVAGSPGDGA